MAGKIAILLDDGFEDLEFFYPYFRVQEDNFEPVVLGVEPKLAKGKNGLYFQITETLAKHNPEEFVGLYIPGGHAPIAFAALTRSRNSFQHSTSWVNLLELFVMDLRCSSQRK